MWVLSDFLVGMGALAQGVYQFVHGNNALGGMCFAITYILFTRDHK